MSTARDIDLKTYSYHGIVLPNPDPKNQGRYKIHIPELMPLLKQDEGIWCKNHTHKYRWGPSDDFMYGSYFPLQPGTKVLIKFYDNDYHSGYVDRILSDQIIETTPKVGCKLNPEASTDRDDLYMILKTPKKHNLFIVLEDTQDGNNKLTEELIPNSIHFYYNYRRTTFIINEDGVHLFTMDNRGVTVEGNNSEWVNKNEKLFVKENRDVFVNGMYQRHYINGNDEHIANGDMNFLTNKHESHIAGKTIALDASKILLNCGAAQTAKMALPNKGEDEIIKQNKLDMRISGHQKPEDKPDTYMGESSKSVIGGSPSNSHPDVSAVQLSNGLNDRQGAVGAEQAQTGSTPVPSYPPGDNNGMIMSPNNPLKPITPKDSFENVAGGAKSAISGAIGGLDKLSEYSDKLSDTAKSGLATLTNTMTNPIGDMKLAQPILDNLSSFNNNLRDSILSDGNVGIDFSIADIKSGLGIDNVNDYMKEFANSFNSVSDMIGSTTQNSLEFIKGMTDGEYLNSAVQNTLKSSGVNQLYNELMNIGQTLYDGANKWINPLGIPC